VSVVRTSGQQFGKEADENPRTGMLMVVSLKLKLMACQPSRSLRRVPARCGALVEVAWSYT
jgi:hypothetical protein